MRLRAISEARSRTIIHDTGEAIGDLIDFIYSTGRSPERQALDAFLKEPTARSWDQIKWIVDAAMQKGASDPTLKDRMEKWASLRTVTAPIAASALYDIEPKQVKGTPLQRTALPRSTRDKYKRALGPQGFIGAMAGAGELPQSKLKELLRNTAQDGTALIKASQKAIPSIKSVSRF